MVLTLPKPVPLDGELLSGELVAAGLNPQVTVDGDLVLLDLNESDRNAAQTVLDAHPAKAQAEAQRMAGERTNESTIRDRAAAALAANLADVTANDSFLAIASPTNAQILAHVRELTRHDTRRAKQVNGLIRLALNRFDGTD